MVWLIDLKEILLMKMNKNNTINFIVDTHT